MPFSNSSRWLRWVLIGVAVLIAAFVLLVIDFLRRVAVPRRWADWHGVVRAVCRDDAAYLPQGAKAGAVVAGDRCGRQRCVHPDLLHARQCTAPDHRDFARRLRWRDGRGQAGP